MLFAYQAARSNGKAAKQLEPGALRVGVYSCCQQHRFGNFFLLFYLYPSLRATELTDSLPMPTMRPSLTAIQQSKPPPHPAECGRWVWRAPDLPNVSVCIRPVQFGRICLCVAQPASRGRDDIPEGEPKSLARAQGEEREGKGVASTRTPFSF